MTGNLWMSGKFHPALGRNTGTTIHSCFSSVERIFFSLIATMRAVLGADFFYSAVLAVSSSIEANSRVEAWVASKTTRGAIPAS